MNIAIIHYHLQPGGVTRIIQSQIKALAGVSTISRIRLFAGAVPDPSPYRGIELIIEPSLDYLEESWQPDRYREAAAGLSAWLRSRLSPDEIAHVHNPTLGKNPLLTYALFRRIEEGGASLYHCHDFPEDRPDRRGFNSRILGGILGQETEAVLYPQAASCCFGVLNSRDYGLLERRGIDARRIRLLPNPVRFDRKDLSLDKRGCREEICRKMSIPEEKTIFLYPVRVIRRKNIGEMILFSHLFADRAVWLVTMAPHNPLETVEYHDWQAFAAATKAPVHFEAGAGMPFPVLMNGADRIITTSRREGFGMSYLESWLFGKPVVGRNIGYVTQDFTDEGLLLGNLYDTLPIETPSGRRDFAELAPEEQRTVIRRLMDSSEEKEKLLAETGIQDLLFREIPAHALAHNRAVIEERYSLESYGKRLSQVYEAMSSGPEAP